MIRSVMIRLLGLVGVGVALTVTALSVTPSVAAPKNPYACMTDDGYGRMRPCSALYKRQHPNWQSGPECFTDDGYGRYRPCSQLFWQSSGGSWSPFPTGSGGSGGSWSPFPTGPAQPK